MSLLVLSVLIAVTVSFLCSIAEAALLSLSPAQVADISARRPRLGAVWRRFKENIERPIAVIVIVNTTALTMGSTVAGAQANKVFHGHGILLFSVVLTLLMLQFAEILPKTLGVRYNQRMAVLIARPLDLGTRLLSPALRVVHWVNEPFEGKHEHAGAPTTLEEISALAGLARLSNLIGSHQESIIRGASRLSRTPVGRVMVPVDQVTFLYTSQNLMDAIIAAHFDPHTRFPICEENDRNRVLGYVNFKEMIYHMRANPNDLSLRGIIRPVHFVSPNESAAALLQVFVEQHVHMAIVRDEKGNTAGLVTLEDIVEELVGELEDEFEQGPRMFHPLSGGTWMVGGGMAVSEAAKRIGIELPDCKGTVSAWLIRRMGRVPKPGEIHREGNMDFFIRRLRRGRIFEVTIARAGSMPAEAMSRPGQEKE